ncbi:hypothetical protein GWK47_041536 [Chionoecetes opilio]|uniref:Endonuclease/exonuclease/phosphatase domain-containing protein n=1 Tax=Chionoecetes opilio TaxID=41210 RepID=A0A8J4Y9U8_CHIOP|nr:hypothetical protein GWK47_041536 [Chionoecetes opilio]
MGHVNARFGAAVCELPVTLGLDQYSYPNIPDRVQPNDNANALLGICIDERLLIVNNLRCNETMYSSNLTYRQGRVWVSELDSYIASSNMVEQVYSFNDNQDVTLPSDHAPVSVVFKAHRINLDSLVTRASRLGDHAALYDRQTCKLMISPVKFSTIDADQFMNALHCQCVVSPCLVVTLSRKWMNFAIRYTCGARNSKSRNRAPEDDPIERWECLLMENDQAHLWRAVIWRGEVEPTPVPSSVASPPTDEDFKDYFEHIRI